MEVNEEANLKTMKSLTAGNEKYSVKMNTLLKKAATVLHEVRVEGIVLPCLWTSYAQV